MPSQSPCAKRVPGSRLQTDEGALRHLLRYAAGLVPSLRSPGDLLLTNRVDIRGALGPLERIPVDLLEVRYAPGQHQRPDHRPERQRPPRACPRPCGTLASQVFDRLGKDRRRCGVDAARSDESLDEGAIRSHRSPRGRGRERTGVRVEQTRDVQEPAGDREEVMEVERALLSVTEL